MTAPNPVLRDFEISLPTIEGVVLRPWRRGDEESLVEHANDREIWLNLLDRFPHPYTAEDARNWIEFCVGWEGLPVNFAIVAEDQAVGGIGLEGKDDVYRRRATIGYWLGQAFWGRGIATAAVTRTTGYAFERFKLERIEAEVFAWNAASRRVLEKAGYTLEGRLRRAVYKAGKITDSLIYSKLRGGGGGA